MIEADLWNSVEHCGTLWNTVDVPHRVVVLVLLLLGLLVLLWWLLLSLLWLLLSDEQWTRSFGDGVGSNT
jgi:hypothetical protein